jgi:hypothetical protein
MLDQIAPPHDTVYYLHSMVIQEEKLRRKLLQTNHSIKEVFISRLFLLAKSMTYRFTKEIVGVEDGLINVTYKIYAKKTLENLMMVLFNR